MNGNDPYARIHDPIGQLSRPKAAALLVGVATLGLVVGVPLRIVETLRRRRGK